MKNWQIQQAKQCLSEVIRLAVTKGPQQLTHRGQPTAWIISDADFTKLAQHRESLVDFFQRSPHRNVDLKIERKKDLPREVKL
ncbi:MAG: type II toxin-antitoxin system prevent-host-death family antitoxin [Parachlamydiaceae bacterium]